MIAVPTVRTIFKTEAPAASDALQVTVTGHQWWWEFDYPQYGITTANELYLPIGRTVNFTLKTADVIHSFWIPELGGKRDLISNHTNYLWFTPDSVGDDVFNGFCAEFCGTSHANMRFKVFTVKPDEFAAWAKHEAEPAVALDTGRQADARRQGCRAEHAGGADRPRHGELRELPAGRHSQVRSARDPDSGGPHLRPVARGKPGGRGEAHLGAHQHVPGLPCHQGQSDDAGHRRPEPDARRVAVHDRGWPLSERQGAPRATGSRTPA